MASAIIRKLYREARKHRVGCIVGESAISAMRAAVILRKWQALEDMGLVRLHGHNVSADPKRGRPEFLDNRVQLLERFLGLEIHLFHGRDAFAQINHVENGRVAWGQFTDNKIDELQRGKGIQLLAREQVAERRLTLRGTGILIYAGG